MPKPTKTKEELRSLILSEIAGQPVCPTGMDVTIEATDSGAWRALSIPPQGPIAYADCANHIGHIAQRLRSEFDLSSEPLLRSAENPVGWMNRDNASNQVVQQTHAARRKHIAATSGQSVTVGTTVNRAPGPKQLVDFSNADERLRWLKAQTEDVVAVLAARAALRVAPAIPLQLVRSNSRTGGRKLVLRVFRAVAAAWATAAYPSHRDILRGSARAAVFGLGNVKAAPPIRAAAYALAVAASRAQVASRASTAIGYALDAAGSKGSEAFEVTLKAIAADAQLLDERFSPVTIATSQLWPGRIPDWVRDNLEELRKALLGANEDWEVWTGWYDERLVGALANQNHEIARELLPNDIWEQGPKVVNAQIKLMLEEREIFEHGTADAAADIPAVNSIPQQVTAASQFALNADGRIDLVLDPPSHAQSADNLQREMYQEMRHKALAVAGLGHNQLAELLIPVDRFYAALPEDIDHMSINRVWSRGNTLRRHLKAHEMAVASGEPSEPARLPPTVAEMLRDLVDTFNVFIAGDPKGRELDEVRLGPQERVSAQAIVNAALPIVEAVQVSEGLATAAAVEALTEQVEAAREAPANIDGDQAIDLSRKTASNFITETLRVAYVEVAFALREFRSGAYRGAGAVAAVTGVPAAIIYRQEIVTFVVENASNLKVFVEQAFHNPELIRIIEMIVQAAARAG
jgi:hypothetical protein